MERKANYTPTAALERLGNTFGALFTPTKNVPSKTIVRKMESPEVSSIPTIIPRVTFQTPVEESDYIIPTVTTVARSLSAYVTESKSTDEEPEDAEDLGASVMEDLDYGEDEEVVFSRKFRDLHV